jgi:alpha-glucosidase (family GH31 glycosyl hydrolase)
VIFGPDQYTLTADTAGPITFHYFLGDPHQIYRSYLTLRIQEGYPNVEPKFRFFELGWESWAALGWQVNQETVLESITNFQRNGYPIRWAVTGSGFWREGGTTTGFGEFGDTFPDPRKFREQLHERDVKWLIGLRTNFVPPGGPYKPYTERRDVNLEVAYFDGNPLSEIGIEKGYFLKDDDGNLFSRPSLSSTPTFWTVVMRPPQNGSPSCSKSGTLMVSRKIP